MASAWEPAVAEQQTPSSAPLSWAPLSYDPAEFYTRASDVHGHRETISLRTNPDMHFAVAALVASRQIPEYATVGDFWRDAGVHRLHWLSEHLEDPDLRQKLQTKAEAIEMSELVESQARDAMLGDDLVAKTRANFERFIRDEDWGLLATMVQVTEDHAACQRVGLRKALLAEVENVRKYLPETVDDPASSPSTNLRSVD